MEYEQINQSINILTNLLINDAYWYVILQYDRLSIYITYTTFPQPGDTIISKNKHHVF